MFRILKDRRFIAVLVSLLLALNLSGAVFASDETGFDSGPATGMTDEAPGQADGAADEEDVTPAAGPEFMDASDDISESGATVGPADDEVTPDDSLIPLAVIDGEPQGVLTERKFASKWFLVDEVGARFDGWYEFEGEGRTAYFDGKKGRLSGYKKVDDVYYYFESANGNTLKGSKKIDGYYYYFAGPPSSGGLIKNGLVTTPGWIYDGPDTYYCRTTAGVLATGKRTINSKNCYFKSGGKLLNGQIKISGYYYFYDGEDGIAKKAEREVVSGENTYVYFYGTDGKRLTGLVTFPAGTTSQTVSGDALFTRSEGQTAYYTTKGLTYDVKKIGNYFYYFDHTDGHRVSASETESGIGWIQDTVTGKWYAIGAKDRLRTGLHKVGDKDCYFTPSTAALFTGKVKTGKYYNYFDGKNGLDTTPGWRDGDGGTVYYLNVADSLI
jgi:glucan-binding YG repeat protein